MTSNHAELWPGYEQTDEQELLDLLDGKVAAAEDESNQAVDKRLAADCAQAIASYEWLKEQNRAPGEHRQRLQVRANAIVESWRPR
jgi:hypothetical protein